MSWISLIAPMISKYTHYEKAFVAPCWCITISMVCRNHAAEKVRKVTTNAIIGSLFRTAATLGTHNLNADPFRILDMEPGVKVLFRSYSALLQFLRHRFFVELLDADAE